MKKYFLLIVLILIGIFLGYRLLRNKVSEDIAQPVIAPSPTPAMVSPTIDLKKINLGERSASIFVPYWAVGEDTLAVDPYSQIIYFGIAASSSGSLQEDAGLKNLQTFSSLVPEGKQTMLTLRMINTDADFAILKSKEKQQSLIAETISTAKDNGFTGIVLDLEISALPFDTVVKQINDFVAQFSQEAKQNGEQFSILMYGDTFYRLRPFDVKTLAGSVDNVMIMAYDFSKANGDPGPNFPLQGQETFGYDMQKMTSDFTRVVPTDKLTVIFGRFGYDWTLDDQGHSTQTALPLTDQQIQKKFLTGCALKDCVVHRDTMSAETEVTYTDDAGKKHVVWFEDAVSVSAKEKYLRQQRLNNFSDWAYSYF